MGTGVKDRRKSSLSWVKTMFQIHVSPILVVLLIQVHKSTNGCTESIKSVVTVPSCPTSKETWDLAASKKHCEKYAVRQTCTQPNEFIYHCLINGYGNETLEVCAPKRIIVGHCTEFNVAGGIIQAHVLSQCSQSAFPRCYGLYYSSEAYKFPGCYQLVYNQRADKATKVLVSLNDTTPIPLKTDDWVMVLITSAFLVFTVTMCGLTLLFSWIKRHQSSKKDGETNSMISNYGNHPPSKTLIKPYVMNILRMPSCVEFHYLLEDGASENESLLYSGIAGNNQNRNILNTRNTETQTTTDRLGYAIYKTEEDFREENKEQSSRYLSYYRIIDKYFIETQRYIEAKKTFKKYGMVIFTGPPGCGKTIAAIHLIKTLIHKTNRTFRKLQHWEELRHMDLDEKSLIFIDNVFFNHETDKGIENLCDMLMMVNDRYQAVDSYYTESFRPCIIMTVRSKVEASSGGYMDKYIHILNTEFCIDITKLTELEKHKILEEQIAFAFREKLSKIPIPFLDPSFRKDVILPEGPVGFPLCAHLYLCSEEFRRSGVQFFSCPIEYLKHLINDEVEHDKSNKIKSLLLILFFQKWYSRKKGFYTLSMKSESLCKQFLNKISPDLIANFEPLEFRELEFAAQRLYNILVKDVSENKYEFVHDSVYEAVGAYFCETYVTETAMYFPLDIIQHQAYEKLTSEQTVTLVTRLMYEALDKRLSEVFACKIFQSPLFSKQFYLQLLKKDMKTIDHFISLVNESSNVKLPCMFWTCLNNLTTLTELFYDMVNVKNISPCYNLYVSLFGICCYRYSGVLLIADDMLLGNFGDIRERVLMFRDDEDNSVINILISSTFSDGFVAIAIKQLLNDGMSVERGNKHGASPLMIAVQQKLPRMQVIKILVERSPTFHLRDTTGSTVFHHCLGSAHDDKTCAEILGIIISSCNDIDLLNKVNLEGDTALSIAAKYSKYSRIQSILILLEGCRNIVNSVNYDGFSPLHLAVRSLNNCCPPWVELECCVRVVILILSGADTDKKSDADGKAIDECQYDCIRNILHHPKDKKIMKNELDCILDKLKCHEQTSIRSLNCLSKISEGLRGRIARAISYLQNMSFENVLFQNGLDLPT